MPVDRLGIFRESHSGERFIVEIMGDELLAEHPLHTSIDLGADEAKNLLRHYNLPDNEIDLRLASAEPRATAAAFAAGELS